MKNREKVIAEAKNKINVLVSEIKRLIRGSESEYLFHIVYLFPNLFAALAKQRKINEHYFVYNITWLRATNGVNLALNKLLPKFLPLKPPSMLNIKKFKKTFRNNLLHFLGICYDIGIWSYILENKHVNKIIIEDGKAKPYYHRKESSIFQKYVDKIAVDKGYAHWLSWLYGRLRENYKLINALDKHFRKEYRFTLNDLANASMYLEKLVKDNRIMVPKNEIHRVFSKNIRSARADKLLKELTFDREGKNLNKSPLIPLRRGYFLIARWVFALGMHFETWVRPAIESKGIYGIYSDFIGKAFEEYVKDLIEPLVDSIQLKVKITEQKYPEIKPWLNKSNLKKRGDFEIDILAVRGKSVFLISCKGGKKELPKLQISKMWAEFPEIEIRYRIRENKKEVKEIWAIYECITSKKRILKNLVLEGKEIIPVVVYSTVQPLSLQKLRELHNVPSIVKVVTIEELKNLIKGLTSCDRSSTC